MALIDLLGLLHNLLLCSSVHKGAGKTYRTTCPSRIYRAELVVAATLPRCLGGNVLLKISNEDPNVPLEDTAGGSRAVLALRFYSFYTDEETKSIAAHKKYHSL